MRRALAVLLITVPAAVAFPQAAGATLVYDQHKTLAGPSSVFVAHDDGTGAKRLGPGSLPVLAPDGGTVVWAGNSFQAPKLYVSPTASAAPKVLLADWRGYGLVVWSPDAGSVVTTVGAELGTRKLVIARVAGGTPTTVATGYFGGASFSPDGTQLLFTKGAKDDFRFDLYRYDLTTQATVRLTTDRNVGVPLWGPKQIVVSRLVDASIRRYGPKSELFTLNLATRAFKRLTNQKVGQLLFGLTPTAFSADGSRLLGQFGGQDTSYAQVVNPATGKVRTLGPEAENGLQGVALSADGRTVLAATGGADPSNRHDVVTIPYAGGKVKVLVRNAGNPDWDR